jgi:hypothetical protein
MVADDGTTTGLDGEPGTAPALLAFPYDVAPLPASDARLGPRPPVAGTMTP